MKTIAVLLTVVTVITGDIYIHNPRGSNNRLDEQGRERNNANRIFDSQNNNRGGYNVGSLYYYSGSKLMVEWTNQHSCNNPNNHCEVIIQYMCGSKVRDGATTTTIPDNPTQCKDMNCDSDTRYGMHENYENYLKCKLRERNKGLFIADQNLKGREKAKNTRQNPNGNRRGYECPEERDYYPYWHPSPWKDIAVLTNDATRCPYYQAQSENVKERHECLIPRDVMYMNGNNHHLKIPNNKADCEAFRWPKDDPSGQNATWVKINSHNLPAPECMETQFSRDNHLGNSNGGYPLNYNWTIPDIQEENCVMRVRYNISTEDYNGWNTNSSGNKPDRGSNSADLDLSENVGLPDREAAEQRGYVFKNNPEVELFAEVADKMKLRLAINTAQYGRTFQDRTHTFAIRPPPEGLESAVIHNLNVRGKRGNIVQVYPAVEYDFIPNTLAATTGQYVHYQWTGSNTNPHNNDGQGRAGTDRSNVVLQMPDTYAEGSGAAYTGTTKYGHWGRSYPNIIKNATLMGFSSEDLMNLALLTNKQFRGEMSELDDAGTYFDLGPRKITAAGIYHYLSTRNNNFSNRSQKGRIIVRDGVSTETKNIGWNGGNFTLTNGKAGLYVSRGTFTELQEFSLEAWEAEQGQAKMEQLNRKTPSNKIASDFLVIHPENQIATDDRTFTVEMEIDAGGSDNVVVYRSSTSSPAWSRVQAQIQNDVATFETNEGGVYVAIGHTGEGVIAGAVVGSLLLVTIVVIATVIYCRKNPTKFDSVRRTFAHKV